MTVPADRARPRRHARTARPRLGLAVAALLTALPLAACGTNAQTLRPYTPAEGVNFDVGDATGDDSNAVVHVRNLLIISRSPGEGIVSATMVTTGRDTLTSVSGVPYRADGSKGTTFTAELQAPVQLADDTQVVLTNQQPFITVSGADGLRAGLDADVTLQFGKVGSYTTRTPVVDGNLPPYTDVTPSAAPSATPSVTAAASPTP